LGFAERKAIESEAFPVALQEAIRKLKRAHGNLLDKQQMQLCDAFNLSKEFSLSDLRANLEKFSPLAEFTIERDGLKAFIKRLTLTQGKDADWFENVISFLGQLPSKEWTDSSSLEVERKLWDFSTRLLGLNKWYLAYQIHKGEPNSKDKDVYVLKSQKIGSDDNQDIVSVDKKDRARISGMKQELKDALNREFSGDLSHIKAVLAVLVNEYLSSTKNQTVESN
jgi:hypothetical protein